MKRVCELLTLENAEQVLAGRFVLDGEVLTVAPTAGYEVLCENVLQQPNITNAGEDRVTASDDAVRWFNALPENYNGSYLRARIVE